MSSLQSKFRADGRSWVEEPVVFLGSAARVASVDSAAFEMGGHTTLRLDLDVTAIAGAPTLDVTMQTSKDGATWRTLGTFAQKTGISAERKSFGGCDRYVRASCVLGGTGGPGATFSLGGEAL
jgi:hypothetical protein